MLLSPSPFAPPPSPRPQACSAQPQPQPGGLKGTLPHVRSPWEGSRGALAGGQEMSPAGRKHRACILQGFHQGSHGKKSCFMQPRNFSSTHHRCRSGPCLRSLT